MSHDVYELVNGKKSVAYIGEVPWHGLGQALTLGATLETWLEEAGLEWKIERACVRYLDKQDVPRKFEGWHVLFRDDTKEALSVVSKGYVIVQPSEVLEFFREFAEAGNMTLETAGSLKNGTKYWALAKLNGDFDVNAGDTVKPYVLLASSCDKTLATTGQLTSIRVVCNNTLQLSISAKGSAAVKVPHSSKFDHDEVKQEMGLVRDRIERHQNAMRKMHTTELGDEDAMRFFLELLKTPEERETGKVDVDKHRRAVPKIWGSYKNAPGAEDTLWGAVNAVTHSVDFNPHARTADTRLNNAWFGQGANMKAQAYELAQNTPFLDSIIAKTVQGNGVNRILGMVNV